MQVIILALATISVIKASEEKNSTSLEHAKTKRHLLLKNLLYAPKYPIRRKHQADHLTKGQQIITNVRDDLVLLHRSLDWISRVTDFLRRRLPYPYINTNDFSFLSYYAPELYLDIPNYNHGPKPKVHITLKEEPFYNSGHHGVPHQGPHEDFILAASNPKPVYAFPEQKSTNEFKKFIPLTQPETPKEDDKPSSSSKDSKTEEKEEQEKEQEDELSAIFNNNYQVDDPKNKTLVGYSASNSTSLNQTRKTVPKRDCALKRFLEKLHENDPPQDTIQKKHHKVYQPNIADLYRLPSYEIADTFRKTPLDLQVSQSNPHIFANNKHSTHKTKFQFPVKPPLPTYTLVPVDRARLFRYLSDEAGKHVEETTFNLLPYFDIHKRFFEPKPFPYLGDPIIVPGEEDFDWDGHRSLKKDHGIEDSEEHTHVGNLPLEGHAIFDKNKLALYNSYGQFI